MSTDATTAFTDARTATGPRTPQGKIASSRNALQTGLYTAHDFIRPGEEEEYAQTFTQLMDELTPAGILEKTFATEIVGATWRLRRCRLVEEAFSKVADLNFDPMMDERIEKQQRSVDRARSQSHLILRRCMAELGKLQTGRTITQQLADQKIDGPESPTPDVFPVPEPDAGFADLDTLMALADQQLAQRYRESGLSSFCNPTPAVPAAAGSFCKTAPAAAPAPRLIPRNGQCPCGYGAKYKRCCGKSAPPVLHRAA